MSAIIGGMRMLLLISVAIAAALMLWSASVIAVKPSFRRAAVPSD